jgi:hypothetical protein
MYFIFRKFILIVNIYIYIVMSDISTTLSMKGPVFTANELITCSIFNLKMFLFVLMIIICISCLSSCLNSLFTEELHTNKNKYPRNMCRLEEFGNDQFYSYKDTINPGYFTYQNAALTSDSNNLIFGQAKKYVYTLLKSAKPVYIIEIFANLYVLNGNPFGVEKLGIDNTSFKHKYIAYLKNTKTGKKINIGQLLRDGDGVYKLKFQSDDINEYTKFNEIEIVHQSPQKEILVLTGKFTIL